MELYRLGLHPKYFNSYYATSAGVFNAAYFSTEQLEEGSRIWNRHLPRGFWKWYKNDMVYLEKILREIEPIRFAMFEEMEQKIFVALSNPNSLASEVICLNEATEYIEVMLASAAMPFLTGSRKVDGKTYFDAGLISQPPLNHVGLAKFSEVWVIQNTPRGHRLDLVAWKVLSMFALHDRQVRRLLWNCPALRNQVLEQLENNTMLKIIQPAETLPINWRSTDEAAIAYTIELGKQAAQRFSQDQGW